MIGATHTRTKVQTDRGKLSVTLRRLAKFEFLGIGSLFFSYLFNNTQTFEFRASYASEHVNGGKFEETKKNAMREGKGGQPPSGGGNKKRLKSKKLTTGKMHSGECGPDNGQISITGQQQQQFQF